MSRVNDVIPPCMFEYLKLLEFVGTQTRPTVCGNLSTSGEKTFAGDRCGGDGTDIHRDAGKGWIVITMSLKQFEYMSRIDRFSLSPMRGF